MLLGLPLYGQVTELRGVINEYVAVTGIDSCEQRIEVEAVGTLRPGDRVLIIQMKGASIVQDTSGENFGRLIEFGRVGTYHIGTIASITGRSIDLIEAVSRGFDVGGMVQLVRVPRYSSARVVDTVRPMRWNGRLGGVVALEVTDTLWLDAPIDATGMGFRGGKMVVQDREDCSVITRVQDINSSLAGGRGETYAYFDTIVAHGGRGRAAGAGGGGNSSNTGGGGGGGVGAGGQGGGQFSGCGPQVVSGEGGIALPTPDVADRLYLGSGGGAGHANNRQGTWGAYGGGIAVVRASHVFGNTQLISGDGQTVSEPAGIDGAGGGGGGGSVLFEYDTLHTPIALTARGGDGGWGSGVNGCHGPGGGGGGGLVQIALEKSPGTIVVAVEGGQPGRYTAANLEDCVESPHSAQSGGDGVVVGDVTVIEGHAGGVFAVSPISGAPGDSVTVTLSYRGALDSAFRPIRGVTTTIEYDPGLLFLGDEPDRIASGSLQMYRTLTVDASTLAQYPAVLMLGSSGTSTIRIRSVRPDLAVTPRFCQWKAITVDASLSIELCEEGSTRAVRIGPPTALKVVAPNPAQGQSVISFTVAEHGPVTLSMIDAIGSMRRTLFSGSVAAGSYSVAVDLTGVAAGRYVLQLTTRSESASSVLVVQQ